MSNCRSFRRVVVLQMPLRCGEGCSCCTEESAGLKTAKLMQKTLFGGACHPLDRSREGPRLPTGEANPRADNKAEIAGNWYTGDSVFNAAYSGEKN